MEKTIGVAADAGVVTERRDRRQTYLAAGFVVAYLLLNWLTYHFPGRFGVTPFNPHAALAIALLMFCGLKYVPLVFLAVVAVEYTLPIPARAPTAALLASLTLTAGYAGIAAVLTGRLRIQNELDTRRDVARLLMVTMISMLLCGLAYIGMLLLMDIGREGRYWFGVRRFFTGYSVGILVAAPLLFMLSSARRRREFVAFFREREAWLHIAVFVAIGWWVFLRNPDPLEHIRNFYLLFLPLVWTATRFGMMGASIMLVMTQVGLFLIFKLTGYKPLSVFELQLLLLTLVITGLLLGVTIDEQRRASADFRESLKLAAAGEMAAAIAHEINQPLTALTGYATAGRLIAAAPEPDRAQLRETMDKLITESKRTAAIVQRLRDFFRVGATRLERVAIGALVEKAVQRQRAKADAANVSLMMRVPSDVPPVLADVLQIEVVLRNLIANAIESAAATNATGGRVEVTVDTELARDIRIAVRDNGAGIRPADSERLFDSFVTTKSEGMGMGLAVSRAIVEAHGGRIWAVPGNSGILCFTLPADRPPAYN